MGDINMEKTLFICKNCDYTIEVYNYKSLTKRTIIKILKENLITAALFGCPTCSKQIKRLILKMQ